MVLAQIEFMEILNRYFVNCWFFSVPSHTKVFHDAVRGFPSHLFFLWEIGNC